MIKKIFISLLILTWNSAWAEEVPWWKFWHSVKEPVKAVAETSGRFNSDEKRLIAAFFQEMDRRDPEHYQRHESDDDRREVREERYGKKGKIKGRDKPKKQKRLPPGLQKKLDRGGELPPGWQKKVARGEVMDGELYRQSRDLPPELRKRLPPSPAGTKIRQIEDKVVRILEATRVIVDVLDL